MSPHTILQTNSHDYEPIKTVLDLLQAKKYDGQSLQQSEPAISVNPNDYNLWWFRRRCLEQLNELNESNKPTALQLELDRVGEVLFKHQKSYQLWYHRRWLVDRLLNIQPSLAEEEIDAIELLADEDTKNHNYWEYRQWLVQRAKLPIEREYTMIEDLILSDARNNSVWNYREWLCSLSAPEHLDSVRKRETKYALTWLERTPDNEAVVNYLLGWYEDPSAGEQSAAKRSATAKKLIPLRNAHPLLKSTILKLLSESPTAFILDIAAKIAWSEGNIHEAFKIYSELASGKFTFYTGIPRWRLNLLQKIMAGSELSTQLPSASQPMAAV